MDPILADLNPAQKEAVTWHTKPLLVLAGAGSGKTRILTRRIAFLIQNGVPAFQILGVTFTNKAAQEMKVRVSRLSNHEVWISTFHSSCMRILRMDGAALGLPRSFAIYDEQDQKVLIRECIRELNMNEKQIHPKGVKERIQRAKDMLMTPYQYAEKAPDIYEEAVAKVYQLYEQKLERLKGCDFGDLIMKTVLLFDRRPDILRTWQDRFQHILIDEYQDTNHAQYRLVNQLAQARRQITVVGDPDQSIYAWRGADIKNILNFEKDYPECGIIRMEQNYRSTTVILDAANELIQRNTMRKPKALWTEREGGEKIALVECQDEKHEAETVVGAVMRACQEGKTLADQVIFYRVHAQSRILEDMLRRANIPYKIVGGTRFYDRMEIKDVMAYLRVVAFPQDEVSLKRIINVPARGLGKKAMEILENEGKGTARRAPTTLDEVLKHIHRIEGLSPKARKAIASFMEMVDSWRRDLHKLSIRELLERILEGTRYVDVLAEERTVESQARIENIEEFFSVVEDFEENYQSEIASPPAGQAARNDVIARSEATKQSPLYAFLESISLITDLDSWDNGTNVLTMMTLHSAKGLEFPLVYMVGMEEGIFPNVNSYTDDLEDLEEERRLCYVGLTRAKDGLQLSFARQRRLYGATQYNLPSRFLNEIPAECYESRFSGAGIAGDLSDSRSEEVISEEDIFLDLDDDETRRRILFD